MPQKSSTLSFITKAINIHGEKYDYSKVIYLNNRTNVEILCLNHGIFSQTPNNHLAKKGCPKCANKNNSARLTLKKEQFLKKAHETHGNKYDYSSSDYISMKDKILIYCIKHGFFSQRPKDHIHKKAGCTKCGFQTLSEKENTWKYSCWQTAAEKSKNFDNYKVYVIKFYNDKTKECFFKIGKTFTKLSTRISKIPYLEIDTKIFIFDTSRECSEFETLLKKENKQFKYLPLIDFKGKHECFSQLKT